MLAARTVGYMNADHNGAGLEASYDTLLAGTAGRGIFRRMAGGHWKPVIELSQAHSGFDLQTTLDINIQDVAETALERAMRSHNAVRGCVVLMKVETGEIKAMANIGLKKDGVTYAEDYNYAIAGRQNPGSTIKLASFMAMLEEGCLDPDELVKTGNGKLEICDATLSDSHADEGGWGTITARNVFASFGGERHIIDQRRASAMHETHSIDIICLLQGDVSLILEAGETRIKPGQIVIQRGTSHGWTAHGGAALFLAVLIDRR
jgi:cell division protein FtsI (penicillin-binding protein 3)